MSGEKLTTGDVVKLKSGGHAMTIESIDAQGGANCCWFDNAEYKTAYIKLGALMKFTPPSLAGMGEVLA